MAWRVSLQKASDTHFYHLPNKLQPPTLWVKTKVPNLGTIYTKYTDRHQHQVPLIINPSQTGDPVGVAIDCLLSILLLKVSFLLFIPHGIWQLPFESLTSVPVLRCNGHYNLPRYGSTLTLCLWRCGIRRRNTINQITPRLRRNLSSLTWLDDKSLIRYTRTQTTTFQSPGS